MVETPNERLGPDAMVGYIELARGPVAYAMWVEAPSYPVMNELRLRTLEGVLGDVVHTWGNTP